MFLKNKKLKAQQSTWYGWPTSKNTEGNVEWFTIPFTLIYLKSLSFDKLPNTGYNLQAINNIRIIAYFASHQPTGTCSQLTIHTSNYCNSYDIDSFDSYFCVKKS